MIGLLALLVLIVAVIVGGVVVGRAPANGSRVLRWAALALTVVTSAVLTPFTIGDSGSAAAYLLGVPVAAAVIPVAADLLGRGTTVADATGAIAMTVWGVLLALGIGMAFLPAAFLLIAVFVRDLTVRRSRVV
jgi:hypothetical protein